MKKVLMMVYVLAVLTTGIIYCESVKSAYLHITNPPGQINVGSEYIIKLKIDNTFCKGGEVTTKWSSSESEKISVAKDGKINGKITGINTGTVKITVTAICAKNGKEYEIYIPVTAIKPEEKTSSKKTKTNTKKSSLTTITINKDEYEVNLFVGDKVKFNVSEYSKEKKYWRSTNYEALAIKQYDGTATAKKDGNAYVEAWSQDQQKRFRNFYVHVYEKIKIKNLNEKENMTVDEDRIISVDSKAPYKKIKYHTSNTKVLKLYKDKKNKIHVKAVGKGTATITATLITPTKNTESSVTYKIKVKEKPAKSTGKAIKPDIKIMNCSKKMLVGETKNLTVEPKNTYKNIKYKSSNNKVLKVDNKGKVKAVGQGTAKITATTDDKRSTTVTIEVNKSQAKSTGKSFSNYIKIVDFPKRMYVGETKKITIEPKNTYKNIKYKSSDTKILTVDNKGTVKAVGKGIAVITATAENGKSATATISVQNLSIALNRNEIEITSGSTFDVKATVTSNIKYDPKDIKWTVSSNALKIISKKKLRKDVYSVTVKVNSKKKTKEFVKFTLKSESNACSVKIK